MIDCVGSLCLFHVIAWILNLPICCSQSPNLLSLSWLEVHSWTLELVLVNRVLFGFVQGELVRALGGVVASTSLLGVPLGHNSSFLQGPTFALQGLERLSGVGAPTQQLKKVSNYLNYLHPLRRLLLQRPRCPALAMSGLQIPTMPAPNVAPPSTSQPFCPDDTE
ncbi:unnamed protein product [Malus baccata var. baccata]